MDFEQGLNAVQIIGNFNKEILLLGLEGKQSIVTEEVRTACRIVAETGFFPFDPEADDISLLRQIAKFMDVRRLDEK